MIITRGFNSKNLVTRGYGIQTLAVFVEGVCIFVKEIIDRLFNKEIKNDKYYKEGQQIIFPLKERIFLFNKSKMCK